MGGAMLNVDEEILLNQLAQGIASNPEGDAWFGAQSEDDKRRLLRGLSNFILQARPKPEDVVVAIAESRLKPTLTPCVLIAMPNLRVQLAKLVMLPEFELPRVFRLLIELLAVADGRRRKERPLDRINHWWHRDLGDPDVVNDIKRMRDAGLLESLLSFVRTETLTRKQITLGTDIARDLGVDGDDARELVRRFGEQFNVDMSEFDFDMYFGSEGFELSGLVKTLLGRRTKAPMTVELLFGAAKQRRWSRNSGA
ncbi:DUF1493 family protein [Bradyrhizobium sp. LCT2]|uniref:DUF5958 family protein n=1 Tax=Bradyrhizobium sp. LCT2 TaxID=2493093 RepID=UPI0013740D59|nr:DUF5958 family protein [Bradyrhizobium sp. LCT2]QHP68429.1 DUF1493 family protein [Bradyrhizobium sp. LCT2]